MAVRLKPSRMFSWISAARPSKRVAVSRWKGGKVNVYYHESVEGRNPLFTLAGSPRTASFPFAAAMPSPRIPWGLGGSSKTRYRSRYVVLTGSTHSPRCAAKSAFVMCVPATGEG